MIVAYDYVDGRAPPMVTSAFWQNKLTRSGTRIFEFRPADDIMAGSIPNAVTVPEPSTLALSACGLGALLVVRRRRQQATV